MGEYFAVMWNVKRGTEQAVEELFRNYGRPESVVRGEDGSEQAAAQHAGLQGRTRGSQRAAGAVGRR